MEKFRMVIDSTVYIKKQVIKDNNILVASLNVIDKDESFREVEIDNQFIFDRQDKGSHFTTSQPAPGEFLEAFEKCISEGANKIFVVTLSRNISGTYQSANLAKNMLDDPDKVHLFDTQLAAYGTEMIALEVIRMINEDNDEETIINYITNIIKSSGQMFTVENLFSLTKGGRLSLTQAAIGTVLRIKPIIQVVKGKLELVKKERTYKKVHQYILDHVKAQTKEYSKVSFYITSQNSIESARELERDVKEYFPQANIIFTDYLGPVFSIHVGRKGYGLSWFAE